VGHERGQKKEKKRGLKKSQGEKSLRTRFRGKHLSIRPGGGRILERKEEGRKGGGRGANNRNQKRVGGLG